MGDRIYIQMMDKFAIYINDRHEAQLLNNSRKGVALIELLILHRGKSVPNQKLLSTFWSEEGSTNPAISLKTLISRTRAALNKISDGFGNCIVADRGAYHWEIQPDMMIDVYRIEDILNQLREKEQNPDEYGTLVEELIELYSGDLLQNSEPGEWVMPSSIRLHNEFMDAVDRYVQILKQRKQYDNAIRVCRQALDIDNFNEQLHMHLMTALIETKRNNEALIQYKYAVHLQTQYLGVEPSEAMKAFYKQIVNVGRTIEFNLESIQSELMESENQSGAFVCEYTVFKEIFNLQIRNLERLKTAMFLAVIMVSDFNGQSLDAMRQANVMDGLMEILRRNLRKGDAITHFSPMMLALLLPAVDYRTARLVLERIRKIFYSQYPNSEVKFEYRVGPLKSAMQRYDKSSEPCA